MTSGQSVTPLESPLRAGLDEIGIALDSGQVGRLLQFLALLAKWNRVYNLTAVRDPEQMLRQHLLDSLAALPGLRRWLEETASAMPEPALLDVGSGGGLPGVVFAICEPRLRVDCVDAVEKKAAFVRQCAALLGLPNLRGLHARVESLTGSYGVVCSRAFASLPDFITWTRHLVAPGGAWLAMKGKVPHEELAALPHDVVLFHVEPLNVPGLHAERCAVWLRDA